MSGAHRRHSSTVLNNRESLEKYLGLLMVLTERSQFLVSELLCYEILLFSLFEKIMFKDDQKNIYFQQYFMYFPVINYWPALDM